MKEKVHGLREGLKEVEPNGIVGTLLVGWWIAPMKFIADPGMLAKNVSLLLHCDIP